MSLLEQKMKGIARGGWGGHPVLAEVVSRRKEHSKTFALGKDRYMMVVHGKPLHYQEETEGPQGAPGPWKEIRPVWKPSQEPGYAWELHGAPYKAYLAESLKSKQPLKVIHKGQKHEFGLGDVERVKANGKVEKVRDLPDLAMGKPTGNTFDLDLGGGLRLRLVGDNHRVAVEVVGGAEETEDRLQVSLLPLGISAQATYYADTKDVRVRGSNAVYATARSTSNDYDASLTTSYIGQTLATGVYYVNRVFEVFDTSAIPNDAQVTSANIYICADSDDSTTDFLIQVYYDEWIDPVDATTRELCYDSAYDSAAILEGTLRNTASGWVSGTYYSLAVAASRISIKGETRYSLVSSRDVAGTTPVGLERVGMRTANYAGTGSDPYLVVLYETEMEPHVSKTFSPCTAEGVQPQLCIYDRHNTLLVPPWRMMERVSGLSFDTKCPGGFASCSFNLPIPFAEWLMIKHAYRLAVRCGLRTAWEGRIADIKRLTTEGGLATITAYGAGESLKQLRTSLTAGSAETGRDLAMVLLGVDPLMAADFVDILDPEFDLGGMAWTRETLAKILQDISNAGDDRDPPRQWYLNVWATQELPASSSGTFTVAADNKDAYDRSDDGDNSHSANQLRVGYNAGNTYTTGIIFPTTIPRYSRIKSAVLNLNSAGDLGADEPVNLKIYAEASATPSDFSVSWPRTRTKTTAYKAWSKIWPVAGTAIASPDISAVVQEVVNLATWGSTSELCIIIASDSDAPNDTRKQADSREGGTDPSITITWGPPDETILPFHAELIPRPFLSRENVDYLVIASEVVGDIGLIKSVESLENSVTARYGAGPSYTAAAEDATSIDDYDKRENDPSALNAGSAATLTQAENLRDRSLQARKDPVWKADGIKVRRLFDRWGNPVNLACVRAGCVIRIADLPTFDPEQDRVLFIVETRYEHESRTLTLIPESLPDEITVLVSRLAG